MKVEISKNNEKTERAIKGEIVKSPKGAIIGKKSEKANKAIHIY